MAVYVYHYETGRPDEIDFYVSISGCVYPPLPSGFAACASLTFLLQTGDVFPTREQVIAIWQITGTWEDEFTYVNEPIPPYERRRFRRRQESNDDY